MKTLKILLLCITAAGFFQNANAQDYELEGKVVGSLRSASDHMGHHGAVGIDGNFAVTGVHYADGTAPFKSSSGEVYVYKWNEGLCSWQETDIIRAESAPSVSDESAGDNFGRSVSISGNIVAIGAPYYDQGVFNNSGMVYIYELSPAGIATFIERIFPYHSFPIPEIDFETLAYFGESIKIRGGMLIVGAERQNTNATGDAALSSAGAAYIYRRVGGFFNFEAKIVAPERTAVDYFGSDVSIFSNTAVVGARNEDQDEFEDGTLSSSGSAYVFRIIDGEWTHIQKIVAPDRGAGDHFGTAVDMTQGHIIVSAPNEDHDVMDAAFLSSSGSVYIYQLFSTYTFDQKITASMRVVNDRFGNDIAIRGNRIIVGAASQDLDELDVGGLTNAGAAYVFKNIVGTWSQIQKIVPFDRAVADYFGEGVAITDNRIMTAAYSEDHLEDGISGSLSNAGSCYIYNVSNLPIIDTVSNSGPICIGNEVTLSVSGSLNDAEEWVWYLGSCDGTVVGTGASISVSPSLTTTYCVRGEGGCVDLDISACVCTTVEVLPTHWHQSTKNGAYDSANDIITDAAGNVYITGEYFFLTTFDGGSNSDVPISSGVGDTKSYVAKYDNCGNLMWVAYSDNVIVSDDNKGASIVLDENNQLVYVAGNFNNMIHYNGAVGDFGAGSPSDLTTTGVGQQAYVACFNMGDGDIQHINTVQFGGATHAKLNTITINEISGKIYIGGEKLGTPFNGESFIQRYSPSPASIGLANWTIKSLNSVCNSVNDMDYDENTNSLWIIGNFKGTLILSHGTGFISNSTKDAYISRYIDGGAPSQVFLKKGNINGEMFGEGIAVNSGTGHAYFTGQYRGITTMAFQMPGQFLPAAPDLQAYFMAMNSAGNPIWPIARYTSGGGVKAYGYSVAYRDNRVYFTGTYADNTVSFSGGGPLPYMFGSVDEPHLYVVGYTASIGAFMWRNGTVDNTGVAKHIPGGITTDNLGHAFIGGGYSQEMRYMLGTPTSGFLFADGQLETFVMRVDLSASGALEFTTQDDPLSATSLNSISEPLGLENEAIHKSNDLSFIFIPNPAKGNTILQMEGDQLDANYELKLVSLDGKLVYEKSIRDVKTNLYLSDLEIGVYFAIISDQNQIQKTMKLIVE